VEGINAEQFIEKYKFENIAATGVFDGELPLIFDRNGGRIEHGQLRVRRAGGTVSYVGPISKANLGRFSRMAFDALKSVKYNGLTIDLNGPLDGEMVTVVHLNGTNQTPLKSHSNFILSQLTGIPFKFNIQIKAPFRSLFNTARTLQDPSDLVSADLPKQLKVVDTPPATPNPAPTAVHPPATPVQN
ncbi:MAG: YdbH domain-containing protein, partial [Alphaproteobacteria bacterium]|nr:YdbH domain-containing protein [Alphaproteobacteria bacterium]